MAAPLASRLPRTAPAPTVASAVFEAKVLAHRLLRAARDWANGVERARRGTLLAGAAVLAEDRAPLWNIGLDPREFPLEAGKVENLRRAARALDGLELAGGELFSFWANVGAPIALRGFVRGRELREGCIVPGVGGGLCLLSNGLYAVARAAGFRIVERHAHSRMLDGSRAARGEDATVAWNYVDLRFVSSAPFRLEVRLNATELIVRVRGDERAGSSAAHERTRRPVSSEPRAMPRRVAVHAHAAEESAAHTRAALASCLSCDRPCPRADRKSVV